MAIVFGASKSRLDAVRRLGPRALVAVLALLAALLAAGCAPSTYSVELRNDTEEVVIAHPVSVQHEKSFQLQPGQTLVRTLSDDTVGLDLRTASGARLGCLQPIRKRGSYTLFSPSDADRVSLAHGECPAEGWFNFAHIYFDVLTAIPALPLVLGPLGAAVWLFIWARRRPRRARLIAAAESVGLCGLSAVIVLLLVRWGGP